MSFVFLFALLVFALQIAILALVLTDLLSTGYKGNALSVPFYVDSVVTFAQLLGIILAVATQDDFFTSLYALDVIKYDSAVLQVNPSATFSFWIFSNLCRLMEGTPTLAVSFVFIVRSRSVLSIFTRFAGVQFVATIDNIFFVLASKGYMGQGLERATLNVQKITFPELRGQKRCSIRHVLFLSVFAGMVGGWTVVQTRQKHHVYLQASACKLFSVQFGKEYFQVYNGYNPKSLKGTIRDYVSDRFSLDNTSDVAKFPTVFYSYFSGTYTLVYDGNRLVTRANRPVYVESLQFLNGTILEHEKPEVDPTRGKFFYCDELESWVFSVDKIYDVFNGDCFYSWMMKSPKTQAFTLEDVPASGWSIWTGKQTVSESFTHICQDCTQYPTGADRVDADCNYDPGAVCKEDGLCEAMWPSRLARK